MSRGVAALSAIGEGRCVRLTGYDPVSGRFEVDDALANDASKLLVFGFTEAALGLDDGGEVVIDGKVSTGQDQSAWAIGDPCYLADDGSISNVKGTFRVVVGRILDQENPGNVYFRGTVTPGLWA